MKPFSSLILGALMLLITTYNASALTPTPDKPFFGVTLSASLSTQGITGTLASIKTVHVSNKTITDAVFSSGSSNAAKAGDLALVLDRNIDLVVVNTSSNEAVVAVIASTGTNQSNNAVFAVSKSQLSILEEASDYEFTLPAALAPNQRQVTNVHTTGKLSVPNANISKLDIMFSGGLGSGTLGATFFQGTLKQTSKVYP